ncbi:MAG: type II secretion system F family protein [bacterium]|nr:type II secretion system F family protein [bacterium]
MNGGRRERGEINAESRDMAIKLLKDRGWTPTSVNMVAEKQNYSAPGLGGVSVIRLAAFTRKFATLVKTDLPVTEIFSILAEGEEGHLLPEASIHVANRIANGVKLGEAMAERPRVFSRLYIHMVEAGMNSGTLDLVAQNLAKLYESESALRKQLFGKLAYPVALLVFTFAISLILKGIGFIPTPLFILMMTFWVIFVALVLLGRTAPGYRIYREIGFLIPGIGKMMRTINLARFCRVFGLQFAAGVPVLQGLEVSKEVLQDTRFRNAVDRMQKHIVDGMNLRDSMVASGVFPAQMAGMIRAGEKAGGVEEMLEKMAEYYEQDIETMTAAMVTIIYFVVYLLVAGTACVIIFGAWSHYFGIINSLME